MPTENTEMFPWDMNACEYFQENKTKSSVLTKANFHETKPWQTVSTRQLLHFSVYFWSKWLDTTKFYSSLTACITAAIPWIAPLGLAETMFDQLHNPTFHRQH